jgi:peptidylprolyl isomerase
MATTLLLSGCGNGATNPNAAAPATASCDVTVTGPTGGKPTVTVPNCPAPTKLEIKDLTVGTGAAVKAGDTAVVQYTLYGWEGKKLVQSSYDSGQPFPVQDVGKAQVIAGWNQGLIGLKQGGRRLLLIPAALGYGDQGTPDGTIKPGEALVFVIDALQVVAPH